MKSTFIFDKKAALTAGLLFAFSFAFSSNSITSAYINANFRYSVACVGQPVQFFDETISDDNDPIVSWFWSFGDNTSPSVLQDPSHTYKYSGEYTVSLHIITKSGAKGSFSKIVIVNDIPQADFITENTSVCVGQTIILIDESSVKDGEISEWKWEFGDGTSSVNQHVTKCFFTPGSYDVSLTVVSEDGCIAKKHAGAYLKVNPKPQADFTVSNKYPTMLNPTVTFSPPKSSSDIKQYIWYFGDGDSAVASSNSVVTHNYPDNTSKTYKSKLVVFNQSGCTDTSYFDITVNPEFTFYMPNAFTPNGDGINEYFSGTGIGIAEYEITIFDKKGNPVFTSGDITKKWDGNDQFAENTACPDGVYAWVVHVTDAFGKKHKYMGHVNVIR